MIRETGSQKTTGSSKFKSLLFQKNANAGKIRFLKSDSCTKTSHGGLLCYPSLKISSAIHELMHDLHPRIDIIDKPQTGYERASHKYSAVPPFW